MLQRGKAGLELTGARPAEIPVDSRLECGRRSRDLHGGSCAPFLVETAMAMCVWSVNRIAPECQARTLVGGEATAPEHNQVDGANKKAE